MTEPQKRPAFEPPQRLLRPISADPDMKRPASTVAGTLLVLLRLIAGAVLLIEVAVHWSNDPGSLSPALADLDIDPQIASAGLATLIVAGGIVLLIDAMLAVLIFRGLNWPRVVVMTFSALSISTVFTAWWVQGQEVTLRTSLLSLALDILVLLALSSRSAAAYARRRERA